jgi:hypothetical protein
VYGIVGDSLNGFTEALRRRGDMAWIHTRHEGDVHVTDHPGLPFLGAGETAQGPTRAVLTNAITDATGARLRDMPLGQAKVKSAIGFAG